MNFLLVNDDGIYAPGLAALGRALSTVGNLYVCAPAENRSAMSHSISVTEHVFVNEAVYPAAKRALVITGTPADCTKIGLQFFGEEGIEFDFVYSGINMGSNLGIDTLYSGTVGAAMEAAISGVRAVAVSAYERNTTHFDLACELALAVMEPMKRDLSPDTIVNINVPDLPKDQVKGVLVTSLGRRHFLDTFKIRDTGGFKLTGAPQDFSDHDLRMDLAALSNGYASITPLHFDFTNKAELDTLRSWNIKI